MGSPNFVNTTNRHLYGKVFRVFECTKKQDKKSFIEEIIEKIPEENLKSKLKSCFDKRIAPEITKFSFYLNGLIALFSNGIDFFLNEFDYLISY